MGRKNQKSLKRQLVQEKHSRLEEEWIYCVHVVCSVVVFICEKNQNKSQSPCWHWCVTAFFVLAQNCLGVVVAVMFLLTPTHPLFYFGGCCFMSVDAHQARGGQKFGMCASKYKGTQHIWIACHVFLVFGLHCVSSVCLCVWCVHVCLLTCMWVCLCIGQLKGHDNNSPQATKKNARFVHKQERTTWHTAPQKHTTDTCMHHTHTHHKVPVIFLFLFSQPHSNVLTIPLCLLSCLCACVHFF